MIIDWLQCVARAKTAERVRWKPGVRREHTWRRVTEDHDIWLITAGRGRLLTGGGWVELRPGLCFWMTPGFYYDAEQDPDDPVGMCYVHFDLYESGRLRPYDAPRPAETIVPRSPELTAALMHRLTELLTWAPPNETTPATLTTHADALLRAVLIELDHSSTGPHEPQRIGTDQHHLEVVLKLERQIHAAPGQVRVEAMAEQSGYSPEHLARVFKKVTGQSPKQYALRVRMNQAAALLIRTAKSVADVADELGYADPFYFTRQFQQYFKQSPTSYRNTRRRLWDAASDPSSEPRPTSGGSSSVPPPPASLG